MNWEYEAVWVNHGIICGALLWMIGSGFGALDTRAREWMHANETKAGETTGNKKVIVYLLFMV